MALSSSKRVTLLKEISERLGNEDWSLVDVTLKQFALPTQSIWNDSRSAYVLEMAADAPDQTLIDLAEHCGFATELKPKHQGIDPAFWRKGMFRLFLSHLSSQREVAANLQDALLKYGISAFVAHNDIEPTDEWQTQIETALATCDSLIALLHDGFHSSNWTDQELGYAMGQGVPVFSVHFGQAPYGFIGRFQAFAGRNKSGAELAQEIFDGLRKHKQTQSLMSEVLVEQFEQSGSFAEAKTRMTYLEDLDKWEPSFTARIRAAATANSQINGSYGIPHRVERLARKWLHQKA